MTFKEQLQKEIKRLDKEMENIEDMREALFERLDSIEE